MDIIILIVAMIVGLLPAIILYKWIQKKNKDDKLKKYVKMHL